MVTGTATAPHVQFLAPGPLDPALFFNRHQFEKQHVNAVTQGSRIAFSDYGRMHQERRSMFRHRRYIPAFSSDPVKLRNVLARYAWRYVHGGRPFPNGLENNLPELVRITNRKFRRDAAMEISKDQRMSIGQARYRLVYKLPGQGGWLKVKSAVAYRSWRLGETSDQIAEQLCMTRAQVRVSLFRMCEIAEELGYETFKRRRRPS